MNNGSPIFIRVGSVLMLLAYLLCLIYMSDISHKSWGAFGKPFFRYMPVMLAISSVPFLLMNKKLLFPNKLLLIAFMLLAVWMIIGSIYTVILDNASLDRSFLGRGLCIIVVFPAYLMFSSESEASFFSRWAMIPTLLLAFFMIVMIVIWNISWKHSGMLKIYHEEIFFPVSSSVIAYLYFKNATIKWICTILLIASGVFIVKNTGNIASLIGLFLIVHLSYSFKRIGQSNKSAVNLKMLITMFYLFAPITLIMAIMFINDMLPSGSPEVRVFTFLDRVDIFLNSPLFGSSFIGSPLYEFEYYLDGFPKELVIPSHSDVLDILAFGGVFGLGIFMMPALFLIYKGIRDLAIDINRKNWVYSFSLLVVSIFAWEMLVNPVWGQPNLVVIFWISIGALLAYNDKRGYNIFTS